MSVRPDSRQFCFEEQLRPLLTPGKRFAVIKQKLMARHVAGSSCVTRGVG